MCGIGDSEAPKIFTKTNPRARKEHICCECESIICIGEKYEKITGLWDNFQTFKTCSFCAAVRYDAVNSFDLRSDEGFPFEQLWDCVGMDYVIG